MSEISFTACQPQVAHVYPNLFAQLYTEQSPTICSNSTTANLSAAARVKKKCFFSVMITLTTVGNSVLQLQVQKAPLMPSWVGAQHLEPRQKYFPTVRHTSKTRQSDSSKKSSTSTTSPNFHVAHGSTALLNAWRVKSSASLTPFYLSSAFQKPNGPTSFRFFSLCCDKS